MDPGSTKERAAAVSQRPPPRVVIEGVDPEIDAGRFPVKRIVGDRVVVTATVFTEGHDRVVAVLRHRRAGESAWREDPMDALGGDRWRSAFAVSELGRYEYTVSAWVDAFATWRSGLARKVEARLDVASELREGAALLAAAASRARGEDAALITAAAKRIGGSAPQAERVAAALDEGLAAAAARHPDRGDETRYARALGVVVERERAAVGAWYEFFPRSCAGEPGRHGTFDDAKARLRYAASLGFDVVYLPPIHPIGETHRKGPNNSPTAGPGDPGSPWAIGSAAGGHCAVHPELGTLADFDAFVAEARSLGVEVALDIAFQCSPDHPWVAEHSDWFRKRPDGSIQYAENPPKKYQDVYPLDFECEDWRALWQALLEVFLFWVEHGVTIFRVDNPHTKPFAFWEWVIGEVRARHPEAVFLSEAFTRPSVMRYLAKGGFSQSYTYFTWRNTKGELTEYLEELTKSESREYMRPNFFANTPDIDPEFLQFGGRAAFQIRLVLAATLGGSYGIYGPPYELCIADAVPGTEEYLHSEKYEIRPWDLEQPQRITEFVRRINAIRRENPTLLRGGLGFLPVDCDDLIAYARGDADSEDVVVVVVCLSPHHGAAGWIELPVDELGLDVERPFQMHDLLGGARYLWQGRRNYVAIDPSSTPAHVFRVRRRVRTEHDFDYYL
ncbi:MAG: alpha-1,4-glucan--maltose-1-phosphate maltosyltransferase [Gemmatimonadales bacterium]